MFLAFAKKPNLDKFHEIYTISRYLITVYSQEIADVGTLGHIGNIKEQFSPFQVIICRALCCLPERLGGQAFEQTLIIIVKEREVNDTMATIKIDDKEYDSDELSEEAKGQLVSLQFVQAELQRISAQTAALQTARLAYGRALKEALGEESDEDFKVVGDDISFD